VFFNRPRARARARRRARRRRPSLSVFIGQLVNGPYTEELKTMHSVYLLRLSEPNI
jgi:hypothetical protein